VLLLQGQQQAEAFILCVPKLRIQGRASAKSNLKSSILRRLVVALAKQARVPCSM